MSQLEEKEIELRKSKAVAEAAVSLRALRREIMAANGWSLRGLYRTLETPGTNRLRDAQAALDSAVRLNLQLADKEAGGETITPPGLPPMAVGQDGWISDDCIAAPAE